MISAFAEQALNGQRQSKPTSGNGELCKTTLFQCGKKPCEAMYSKEVVTEKFDCPKCRKEWAALDSMMADGPEEEEEADVVMESSEESSGNRFLPLTPLAAPSERFDENEFDAKLTINDTPAGKRVLRLL
jgi:hypothetical protein